MRCHICDHTLVEAEIVFNKELNAFEPCTVCLDAAFDAAYSDGFVKEEDGEVHILDMTDEEQWAFNFTYGEESYD